jgi:hypothetical protein
MEDGRRARLAWTNDEARLSKKNSEACEILNDRCISFGAILQTLELLWLKQSLIQSMQG